MHITYTESELEHALANIFISVNAKEVALEAHPLVAELMGWQHKFCATYMLSNDGRHQFLFRPSTEEGRGARWSSNLYHGIRRRLAVPHSSVSGLPPELNSMRQGAAMSGLLDHGRLSVLLAPGGPNRLRSLDEVAAEDEPVCTMLVDSVTPAPAPGGDYYALVRVRTRDTGRALLPTEDYEFLVRAADRTAAVNRAMLLLPDNRFGTGYSVRALSLEENLLD